MLKEILVLKGPKIGGQYDYEIRESPVMVKVIIPIAVPIKKDAQLAV